MNRIELKEELVQEHRPAELKAFFNVFIHSEKNFFYSKSLSTCMKYRLGKLSSDVKISERNEVPSVFYGKSSLRILKEVSISH